MKYDENCFRFYQFCTFRESDRTIVIVPEFIRNDDKNNDNNNDNNSKGFYVYGVVDS